MSKTFAAWMGMRVRAFAGIHLIKLVFDRD